MDKHTRYFLDPEPQLRYQPPQTKLVQEQLFWRDKRRPFFGLPLSFTRYSLYTERLVVQTGFLTRRTEEIRLYRILDVSMKQSLLQRLFRLGSLKVTTADATAPTQFIHDIRHCEEVHRLVSDMAEEQRKINRIGIMEYFE